MRRSIVDWIRAGQDDVKLDARMHLREGLNNHHVGTCTWLYKDPTFKNWYFADINESIWYHAPPGAGKTILTSVLATYLQEQGSKIAYFSYSFNDPYRKETISAIRSLALQVLAHTDSIPDKVMKIYETEMANYSFTLRDVYTAVDVLQALLRQVSRIHVIVDGLDECSDSSLMSSKFAQLMKADTLGIVKWFLTSRDNDQRVQFLAQQVGANEMVPDSRVIMGDIRIYLQSHLLASGHVDSCVDHWTTASEGNFLWISLTLDTLMGTDLTCDEDIEEELKRFPKGLTGYYLRTLEKLSYRSNRQQELARYSFPLLTKLPLMLLTIF